MKKRLFIIPIILILVLSLGINYLNRVYLPTKIKALIIKGIEDATQKKASLESLKFNIFKGLVLKGLSVYEGTGQILNIKEASCVLLILPFFKRQIVIPALRIISPQIFVERRPDNSFNILELFLKKPVGSAGGVFKVIIRKISVSAGRIKFQDDTLTPVFTKQAENFNLAVSLGLPASAKFNLKCEIASSPAIRISSSGEYNLFSKELIAKVIIKDFSPGEFHGYYRNLGVSLLEGRADISADLKLKNNILHAILDTRAKDILFSKDKITAQLNSIMKADIEYNLKNNTYLADIDISSAALNLRNINTAIEDIAGKLRFIPNKLNWQDLNFKYLGLEYRTSGGLTNFQAPVAELKLSSQDLALESGFSVSGRLIRFSKFSGRYLNSKFLLTADADFSNPDSLNTVAGGELDISLGDLPQLGQIKPQGTLHAKFNLDGNIDTPKMCVIKAELSGEHLSVYGLKFGDFFLNYAQEAGVADISPIRLSLYDGTIEAAAKMNLLSGNLPYRINADIRGVKIEKLKLDTPAKDKDIAGTLQAEANFSGFSSDFSKLTGSGKIIISDGKLWELDLFKGLGSLLFTRDFSKLVFSEGYSAFTVADKVISTDDLKLKSNLADITGEAKIGFDGSLDASLNVELLEEAPLTAAIRDVTTAILGGAGKFGVIKLGGTLKEPKYKFKPVVIDILKGLKDSLFKK